MELPARVNGQAQQEQPWRSILIWQSDGGHRKQVGLVGIILTIDQVSLNIG